MPTPEDIARFDLSVQEAVAYFELYAMECLGPAQPFADSREWLCTQEHPTSMHTVRIIGDAAGVSQLVGVSQGASPDDAVSFLVNVVAAAVAPHREDGEMALQSTTSPELGGRWNLSSATIQLQPHSEARAVIINPAQ